MSGFTRADTVFGDPHIPYKCPPESIYHGRAVKQPNRQNQPVEVILLCSSAMPVLAQWAHEKSTVLAGMEECICIGSNISMLIQVMLLPNA